MHKSLHLLAGSFLAMTALLPASELVEVLPVDRSTLMLHFDDGFVIRHQLGEPKGSDRLVVHPLRTEALNVEVFSISSGTDPHFAGGRQPLKVGRKSKGTDFSGNVSGVEFDPDYGFDMTGVPYFASEHWVYLRLPEPMKVGDAYTVEWAAEALGTTVGRVDFRFDPATTRSESIHINTVAFDPASPAKFGYLHHWAGDLGGIDFSSYQGKPFRLIRDSDSVVVFAGEVAFRKPAENEETALNDSPNRNFLGGAAWECDFSAFGAPGDYRLVVDELGSSFPLHIRPDAFRAPFHAAMKGLYGNRSGIALEKPYTNKPRPAPHNPKLTPGFAQRLHYSTTRMLDTPMESGGSVSRELIESNRKGNLTETWGWYQDAGDWDGYFNHFEVSSQLLLLFQVRPEAFADGELNIPESGNGIPDLVDEGAWLPRFFHRLRHELLEKGWGTGGVGSRIFPDYWGADQPGGIGRGSWQDNDRDWYVTGEDPYSTFRYAANAAQLAMILDQLGRMDPEGVDWRTEAIECFDWALANTREGDDSWSEGTGTVLRDHRAMAAVALFRLTGEARYRDLVKRDLADIGPGTALDRALLYAAVLLLIDPKDDREEDGLADRLLEALRNTALAYAESADRRASRWGGDWLMPMLVGSATTPMILPVVFGHAVLKERDPATANRLLPVIFTTADYFLGGNPLNMTWISGLGPRHPLGFFHLDDWYLEGGTRIGIIPYGPWRVPDTWQRTPNDLPQRGPWSIAWGWDSTYPPILGGKPGHWPEDAPGTWPGHETWFDLYCSPQAGEFTVHQNNCAAAATYGYLAALARRS